MKRNRKRRTGSRVVGAVMRQQLAALWTKACEGARKLVAWSEGLGQRVGAWRERQPRQATLAEPSEHQPRGLDWLLLGSALALIGLGLVMVYSASAVFAGASYKSSSYFLLRDLLYAAFGFVALYVGWRVDYDLLRRLSYPLLITVFLMLIALLIPGVGTHVDGATRWIRLAGFSLQPSEPAKFALVAYLAHSLAKKRDCVRSFSIGFLPHLCVAGLMCLLIVKQPDLGTTAVLGFVTLLMLFVAGTKLSYIVIVLLAAAPVGYQLIVGTPWRLRRLLAYLDPWAYRQDAGYQISESLISIGSGGLFGLGLGEGKQKLFFLPAAHTDFIFAIIGEELGLIGMGVVALLFAILIVRGLRAASKARDLFGTYLAFGITLVFGLQALMHAAVVLGLVPTKGITLPLVSYGGSALITMMFCVGVLLNIGACKPVVETTAASARQLNPSNRRRPSRVVVTP